MVDGLMDGWVCGLKINEGVGGWIGEWECD